MGLLQNSANEKRKAKISSFSLKKSRIFRNRKCKKLSTCFFTDAQLFYTHFLKSAFEASTFCPFCTVNAAAIFNQSAQDWQAVIRLIL